MVQHIRKIHKFSNSQIENDLKLKPEGYKSCFEEIKQVWKMRKHEINKRKKVKQNRRASAKSQVSKKHKRKSKNKQAHRK